MVVPTGESARALSGSGHMYELINAIPRIAFSISTAHRVKTQFGETILEEVYEACVWVMAIPIVEFPREGYKI